MIKLNKYFYTYDLENVFLILYRRRGKEYVATHSFYWNNKTLISPISNVLEIDIDIRKSEREYWTKYIDEYSPLAVCNNIGFCIPGNKPFIMKVDYKEILVKKAREMTAAEVLESFTLNKILEVVNFDYN